MKYRDAVLVVLWGIWAVSGLGLLVCGAGKDVDSTVAGLSFLAYSIAALVLSMWTLYWSERA